MYTEYSAAIQGLIRNKTAILRDSKSISQSYLKILANDRRRP